VTRFGGEIVSFTLALLVVLGGAITLLIAHGIDALLDRTV
jgi:hypothetical protein